MRVGWRDGWGEGGGYSGGVGRGGGRGGRVGSWWLGGLEIFAYGRKWRTADGKKHNCSPEFRAEQ